MSQGPFQSSDQQGAFPQGYGEPPGNPYPPQAPRGGGATLKIVLIILGVLLLFG